MLDLAYELSRVIEDAEAHGHFSVDTTALRALLSRDADAHRHGRDLLAAPLGAPAPPH